MGNETILRKALEDLNSIHNADKTFEEICHIIAKSLLKGYSFSPPSGGRGNQDGGRDGYDANKKARMACSLQKNYKTKIREEIEKITDEKELYFFSNQGISEPEKNNFKNECQILFEIFDISTVTSAIENAVKETFYPELYDLLGLSFLITGEKINRGDIKKELCPIGNIYKKRASIIRNNETSISDISENPLCDFLFSELKSKNPSDFPNVLLKGIGGIGKSTVMKQTFNSLVDHLHKAMQETGFAFYPYPFFYELKYYEHLKEIPNNCDPIFYFLDGLDEISETAKMQLKNEIDTVLSEFQNVRFIISGRDASFIDDISTLFKNSATFKVQKFIDPEDVQLRQLLEKYKNTPVQQLLSIPYYRNFAENHPEKTFKSITEFQKEMILERLKTDNERLKNAAHLTRRQSSPVNIDEIIKKLSQFCYEQFLANKSFFSENELDYIFNNIEKLYILDSSLIEYYSENMISFISIDYYHYFAADYFSEKSADEIDKAFFKTVCNERKIQTSKLSVFSLLLLLLKEKNTEAYGYFFDFLVKSNVEAVLLFDYEILSDEERYTFYTDIVNKRNSEKKYIYYGKLRPSFDILANIDSLADKLAELLPKTKFADAVQQHINVITAFLQNPSTDTITTFANALMLLGVYQTYNWGESEQDLIKSISIPVLQFFIENPLNEKVKNLLSMRVIFYWYKAYEWVRNWKKDDWNNFIHQIDLSFRNCECEINSEKEFATKIAIFNLFYEEATIREMLKYLVFYYITKCKRTIFEITTVPETIDDNYNPPITHFDSDIFGFEAALKNIIFTKEEILDIFSELSKNSDFMNYDSSAGFFEIREILFSQLNNTLKVLEETDFEKLYTICLNHITSDEWATLDTIHFFILSDTVKKSFFTRLIEDLQKKKIKNYFMILPACCDLLNITDKDTAVTLLKQSENITTCTIYKDIIYKIANSTSISTHTLFEECQSLYQIEFPELIKKENEKKEKINALQEQINSMYQNEINIAMDKEKIVEEIEKIYAYIETSTYKKDEDLPLRVMYLFPKRVIGQLSYFSDEITEIPPIFSAFVLQIVYDFCQSGDKNFIIGKINSQFSEKKYYYRFFMFYYIRHHLNSEDNHAEIKNFIHAHSELKEKIEESMKLEVSEKLAADAIANFDGAKNKCWTGVFAYYLHILYDNICPDWVNKNHAIKFIAFPLYYFSIENSIHFGGNFSWGGFKNIFEWMEHFFGFSEEDLITACLQNFDQIRSDPSKAQVIQFLGAHINGNCDIRKLLIEQTIEAADKNFQKNEFSECNNALSVIWNHCTENYVDELLCLCEPENLNKNNYCLESVFKYIIRIATNEQKKRIIKKLEKSAQNEKVQSFLAELGNPESIIAELQNYFCRDKEISGDYPHFGSLFGFLEKNEEVFFVFLKLLEYCLEKKSTRRNTLMEIAIIGIKQHISEKQYSEFKTKINELIVKNPDYAEFLENFVLEVEQSL